MPWVRQPHLSPDINEALVRLSTQLDPPWALPGGSVVEVTFPTADTVRPVRHGLGAVPDGYLVLLATGAVYAVTPEAWTEELALLKAPVAHTFARLWFVQLRAQTERV